MIQDVVIETAQAMNAMQLSMAYSTAMINKSMETQEMIAENMTQMLANAAAPVSLPAVDGGHIIDTYA